jgi:Zn-dependent protease with chaperone function/predicted Zn-dependent protease
MTYDGYQDLIKRLESYAQRQPKAYRVRVLLLALLGYGYVSAILGLVAAALAAVVWIWSQRSHGAGYLLVKIVLTLAAFGLVILRSLWVRLPSPIGVPVTAQEAPELFALLDRLQKAHRAPRCHQVLLTADFNASIMQVPRLGFLGWSRNYLVLGLPLMEVLSPSQFEAVVAHELGHLSRAHGRFASWIYRVRLTVGRLAGILQAHRHWGSLLFERFFGWYAPYFSAYSFVLAREQEYEADAQAARLAGSIPAREALVTVSVVGRFLERSFWPSLARLAVKQAAPPETPLADLARAFKTGLSPDDARRWLKEEMSRLTGYADSHPALQDRLAALGKESRRTGDPRDLATWPHLRSAPRVTALDHFVGDRQRDYRVRLESDWIAQMAVEWKARHVEAQEGQRRLIALAQKAVAKPLTVEEQWEQARWSEELKGEGEALPLLKSLLTTAPHHAQANFAMGRLLLDRGEARGVALIERAMAKSPDLVLPGCRLIADYQSRQGNEPDVHRYLRRADELSIRLDRAESRSQMLKPSDQLVSHGLSLAVVMKLRAALAPQARVAEAYLVRRLLPDCPDVPFYVLAIVPRVRWYEWWNESKTTELAQLLSAHVPAPPHTSLFILERGFKRRMLKRLRAIHDARVFTQRSGTRAPAPAWTVPMRSWRASLRRQARRLAWGTALVAAACALLTIHHHPSPNCGEASARAPHHPPAEGFVYLAPVGEVPAETLRSLTAYYRKRYGLPIDLLPAVPIEAHLRDTARRQVMGQRLLAQVQQQYADLASDPQATVIGLATEDLYLETQDWAFAFNARSVRPRVAVVSAARLDPGFWPSHVPHQDWFGLDAADRTIAQCRLQKLVTRNLGVLHFQQAFNDDPKSPLASALLGVDDLDAMREDF